jgi:hypothetical protein
MQAMRDKIDMYDRCILALGHESEPDTPVGDMVCFLEEERNRVRYLLNHLLNRTVNHSDHATMLLDMKD